MQLSSLHDRFRQNMGGDLIGGVLLWSLLLATYLLYAPAMDAPWQFDDAPNLQGLAEVHDPSSAVAFVTRGIASSVGRPLALAAFIPNAHSWPTDPSSFRHFNVLLHLLNGVLVAWLALSIGRILPRLPTHPVWPALTLSAIWLLHPFLASTSLLVVQRMTLIAANFTLISLIAFVHGRKLLAENPRTAYIWMSCALVLGACLGVLAKENAALLPFFAAALSATVLAHLPYGNQRLWRTWQIAFFAGPAILLLVYTAINWSSIVLSYAARPFSLEERLLTQPVILWDYLQQLLAPNVSRMGPFHDDVTSYISLTPPVAISILSLSIALVAAIGLRKRLPWAALAIFWFLAGHLLESTVFNLEMYFEHRNYLPSIGPLAALVSLAWSSRSNWPRYLIAMVILVPALLLWQVTTLWGNPRLAAERWATEHPKSSRATQFLAQRFTLMGDEYSALRVIKRGSKANPSASDLAVQTLQLSCGLVAADDIPLILENLISRAATLDPSLATAKATDAIRILTQDKSCPGLDEEGLIKLINALLENPAIYSYSLIRHHLHHQLAEIFTLQGNLDGAVRNLQAAFEARPNPETAQLLAVTLASAGLYKEALTSLDNALSSAPTFALRRNRWEIALEPLRKMITNNTLTIQQQAPDS